MLEEYLVEHLPRNSLIETFGCELTLINADTQIALQDPIQKDLWKNNHFSLVVHDCFRMLEDNKPLQGLEYEDCPKAIKVSLRPKHSTQPRVSATSNWTSVSAQSAHRRGDIAIP